MEVRHVIQEIKLVTEGQAILNRRLQKLIGQLAIVQLDNLEKIKEWKKLNAEYIRLATRKKVVSPRLKRKRACLRTEQNRIRRQATADRSLLERYAHLSSSIEKFGRAVQQISTLGGVGVWEFCQKLGRVKTEAKRIPSTPLTYPARKRKQAIARLRRQLRNRQ